MWRHYNKQSCNISIFRWYPSILCTDPASVVIRLRFWPWWHPRLLMLHYEYSEYFLFNTRLLPVTHAITIGCQPDHNLHYWILKCTRNFQHLPRFEPWTANSQLIILADSLIYILLLSSLLNKYKIFLCQILLSLA